MNFNVYVDKNTGERLERLAKARRTSRNALVREALERLLDQDVKANWPEAVLAFQGIPKARPFEDTREMLEATTGDSRSTHSL